MAQDDPFLPGLQSSPEIDTAVSHSARVWDYWLGGRDHYQIDRDVGSQIERMLPGIVQHARADRLFLGRAVRYLAGEAGIRQFLDIGAGLPTVDNTHEVAQRAAPECRVVYVDNDPLVLVHARALLASTPEGAASYVHADMRDPGDVLAGAAQTLDLGKPVAITMLGVLWHILDDGEARQITARLMGAVAPGSYLAVAHPTVEVTGDKMTTAVRYWNLHGKPPGRTRTPREIAGLLNGLDLVEPGVVSSTRWRPEATPFGEPEELNPFCAVGKKC
jgi:O-methyltransferase involved in polyketide biosynthesis